MKTNEKRLEDLEKKTGKDDILAVVMNGIYTVGGVKYSKEEFEAKYGTDHEVIKVGFDTDKI